MNSRKQKERALLIGTRNGKGGVWEEYDSLEELSRLAESAGAEVVGSIVQELKKKDASFLIGRGKVEEVRTFVNTHAIDIVVFDDELTPTQQSNLETIFNTKTIDRTSLILDIFAQRARSKEGKLQVELAQLIYTLPRLKGKGVTLSRLGGGIGTRGPGETQLEMDRRKIKQRIARLKKAIDKVSKVRELHRQGRKFRSPLTLALVGYTNAGKSTLLNRLTHTGVLVDNRPFSTLDPKIGKLTLPHHQEVFISDTVGFIHKLPHQLIAAFKATFEEVSEADLLLHVIDISHPRFESQIDAVNQVLEEIGIPTKKTIHILNKIDRVSHTPMITTWVNRLENAVALSALTGQGVDTLLTMIERLVTSTLLRVKLTVPYTAAHTISQLVGQSKIISKRYFPKGVTIEAEVPHSHIDLLKPYLR